MNRNKKRKQTLESAQYGLEITFNPLALQLPVNENFHLKHELAQNSVKLIS